MNSTLNQKVNKTNETFPDFLNHIQADSDMIQQALRIHLSERTNDLTRKEMLEGLKTVVTKDQELERQLKLLEQDSSALEQAALIYFERAWEDEAQKLPIRAAFEHVKDKLPVIEVLTLAVVAMYGMYLVATEGVTEITIRRNPDGSYEKTEKREPFAPIVSAMEWLGRKRTY